MRLADPLRDFSQPSVEPCVAYVSDPLPMAGPDDPVLLSFETSADRSDNPLGVVEPVGDFYALAKGRPLPLPRHCDVHGTIYAIRRHLLHAVNQGARKIVLISLHLDKKRIQMGVRGSASRHSPPYQRHSPRRRDHRMPSKDRLVAAIMTSAATFTGIPGTSRIKITARDIPSLFGGILHILARYGGPQDLYRTIRRFVKLPH